VKGETFYFVVMPANAGIHVFLLLSATKENVDARHKAGHDERKWTPSFYVRLGLGPSVYEFLWGQQKKLVDGRPSPTMTKKRKRGCPAQNRA
jgi:hypothetical protein